MKRPEVQDGQVKRPLLHQNGDFEEIAFESAHAQVNVQDPEYGTVKELPDKSAEESNIDDEEISSEKGQKLDTDNEKSLAAMISCNVLMMTNCFDLGITKHCVSKMTPEQLITRRPQGAQPQAHFRSRITMLDRRWTWAT